MPTNDTRNRSQSPVAIVLKGYPRLSETFIAQEILALQEAGFDLRLVSLRHPTDKTTHPIHAQITAPVTYLPEYLRDEPLRVLRGLLSAVFKPGFHRAFKAFREDLQHDRSRNRLRRFGQACVLANECARGLHQLHAHFIHTPASVTRYASLLTRVPWTCSAHAKDIWTSEDWELSGKLEDANWTVTCTQAGHVRLRDLAPEPDRVHLSYHGIDLRRFPPPPRHSGTDGSDPAKPVRIITVGRAVEKKGFDILLEALARLPGTINWTLTHIGGGELLGDLKTQADDLKLADRVTWKGALPQEQVLAAYREADIFALPCRITADGDRDGLPNVLMEAQSQRLACISTDISGVGELIEDGKTGVLVPPEDAGRFSAGLEQLISDVALREKLAAHGEGTVRARFDHRLTNAELIALFDETATTGTRQNAA